MPNCSACGKCFRASEYPPGYFRSDTNTCRVCELERVRRAHQQALDAGDESSAHFWQEQISLLTEQEE